MVHLREGRTRGFLEFLALPGGGAVVGIYVIWRRPGRAMRLLQRTLLTLADRPVADAVAAHGPAAIVSFHPVTGGAADRAGRRQSPDVPVMTVVTDLVTSHAAWHLGRADRIAVPSAAVRRRCGPDGLAAHGCLETGLPVTSGFRSGPLPDGARAALRRSLGASERRFLAVVTGGGEGSGGMARRVAAYGQR